MEKAIPNASTLKITGWTQPGTPATSLHIQERYGKLFSTGAAQGRAPATTDQERPECMEGETVQMLDLLHQELICFQGWTWCPEMALLIAIIRHRSRIQADLDIRRVKLSILMNISILRQLLLPTPKDFIALYHPLASHWEGTCATVCCY